MPPAGEGPPPEGDRGTPPGGTIPPPPPNPARAPSPIEINPGTTTPVTASVVLEGPGMLPTEPTPAGASSQPLPPGECPGLLFKSSTEPLVTSK